MQPGSPGCKTYPSHARLVDILNIKGEEENLLWGKFLRILGECPIKETHIPTLRAGKS